VICSSRFGVRWSQSVMGVWENASASTATSTSKGVLVLYEKGSQVIGISTTTDSAWEGHFSNGILTATYVNKYNITGSLRLTLSSNGSTLYGTWTSGTESGTYEAARSPTVEKLHLLTCINNSSMASKFHVTDGLLDLDINAVISYSQSKVYWPQSVTGVWENASVAESTSTTTTKGILILYEKAGFIAGVSTTTDSVWRGHFLNGVLKAYYVNKYNYEGYLELVLSSDGSTLKGTWKSVTHGEVSSGTYHATRSPVVERQNIVMCVQNSTVGARFNLQ